MPGDTSVTEAREGFLFELSQLTRNWGFVIAGCGCCGSPWVEHRPEGGGDYPGAHDPNARYVTDGAEHLEWTKEN